MVKKRTRNIIVFAIVLIILITAFFAIWFNSDYLKSLIQEYIQRFGYLGIFVFSFLADLLEQPIGPGTFAALGVIFNLNIFLIIVFSVIGSWIGSLASYYIGRRYFYYRLREVSKGRIEQKHYKLFEKYGGPVLALAAISPLPWVTFCWLAGGAKLKVEKFIFWGLIPRILRISFVVGLVWYTGFRI
tara:strand:- start:163 stop:723 length:561 start_codon:yes stop_codon:yes gene_type:complete